MQSNGGWSFDDVKGWIPAIVSGAGAIGVILKQWRDALTERRKNLEADYARCDAERKELLVANEKLRGIIKRYDAMGAQRDVELFLHRNERTEISQKAGRVTDSQQLTVVALEELLSADMPEPEHVKEVLREHLPMARERLRIVHEMAQSLSKEIEVPDFVMKDYRDNAQE